MEHLGFPTALPGVVEGRESRQSVKHQEWSVILHYDPSKLSSLLYFCSFINKVGQKRINEIEEQTLKPSSCSESMIQK